MRKLSLELEINDNVGRFLDILAYIYETSVEKLLQERLLFDLRADNVATAWEVWMDPEDVLRQCGLIEEDSQEAEPKIQHNPADLATQLPNKATVVDTLERATDLLSLSFRDKMFQEFLMDNVVVRRVLSDVQQTLVELKGSLQFPEDTVKIKVPVEAMNLLTEHAQSLGKSPEETLKEMILRKVGACPVEEGVPKKNRKEVVLSESSLAKNLE